MNDNTDILEMLCAATGMTPDELRKEIKTLQGEREELRNRSSSTPMTSEQIDDYIDATITTIYPTSIAWSN